MASKMSVPSRFRACPDLWRNVIKWYQGGTKFGEMVTKGTCSNIFAKSVAPESSVREQLLAASEKIELVVEEIMDW